MCKKRYEHRSAVSVLILGIFIGIILTASSQQAIAQQNILQGIIIDNDSGNPISDVHIMNSTGESTVSDVGGRFSISIRKYPAQLRITHVSYGQSDVKIDDRPDKILAIRIQKMVSRMDEVQITAERMRILTKGEDYSLQDFAFDENWLWMIGFIGNQPNKGRLIVANAFADTIASIPIRGAERLFRDVFNNVHLVFRDSVYQLFFDPEVGVKFSYGTKRKEFDRIMEPILAGFNNKLVYRTNNLRKEETVVYYYDEVKMKPQYLTRIVDSLELLRKYFDRRPGIGSMWVELQKTRYWMANTKISRIYKKPVQTPMFCMDDHLYIVNPVKDSLLEYNENGKFIHSQAIDFHKDSSLGDVDVKEMTFLVDDKLNKVYLLDHRNAGWIISPLDIQRGTTNAPIPLPNYPGMTNITVRNDAVYFLYYDKNYPFYTRLYRFQI